MSSVLGAENRSKSMAQNRDLLREGSKGKIKDGVSPDECYGAQIFNFPNGDMYIGQFKATVKEEVFRHGYGKYFCNDGSIYSGMWHEDQLIEAKTISFVGGDTYTGTLKNFQFSGTGNYNMTKVGNMKMTFIDNYPSGEILLTDPYGFIWQGYSNDDCNETILFPVNHFKDMTQLEEYYLPKEENISVEETEE